MQVDFLHIGLHKTATKWLQTEVFPNHPELFVIQVRSPEQDLRLEIDKLYQVPYGMLDEGRWRANFQRLLQDVNFEGRKLGISNEAYSGKDSAALAERLHRLFSPTKIILILRHPVDFIRSMYQQYVMQGGTQRLNTLLNDVNIPGQAITHKVNYAALVGLYQGLFGADNVLVLPFELLVRDQSDFLRRLWDFTQVRPLDPALLPLSRKHESVSRAALWMQRFCNRRGMSWRHTRGRIRRFDERIIRKLVRLPFRLNYETLCSFKPELRDVLVAENYRIWTGDLARFNYIFGSSAR
jgi:hypothetical protein